MLNKKRIVILVLMIVLIIFFIKISSANLVNLIELDNKVDEVKFLEDFLEQYLGKEIEIKWIKVFYIVKETNEDGELTFDFKE